MYTQPSKSAAGGVAIYVKDKLDHFKRDDLSILHDEFESLWVEIKNKKGKNFLCGCIYRQQILMFPTLWTILSQLFTSKSTKISSVCTG